MTNSNALEKARALELPSRKASLHREASVTQFWNHNRKLLEEAWAEWEMENKDDLLIPDEMLLDPRLRKAIIHRGNVPHATHPITSGQRSNLVVWLYGERMQIPQGGASSYGNFTNSASAMDEIENITARQRWSVPSTPKDSYAPF